MSKLTPKSVTETPITSIPDLMGRKVSFVEVGSNIELLGKYGMAKTISSKLGEMVIVPQGVLLISRRTGEEAIITTANLKLIKLMPLV